MRQLLLLTAICLLTTSTFAENPSYCEAVVYRPWFKRFVVEVSYGNANTSKHKLVRKETGKPMKFDSEAGILNYMAKDGWKLVSVYHTRGGDSHFFLKKED